VHVLPSDPHHADMSCTTWDCRSSVFACIGFASFASPHPSFDAPSFLPIALALTDSCMQELQETAKYNASVLFWTGFVQPQREWHAVGVFLERLHYIHNACMHREYSEGSSSYTSIACINERKFAQRYGCLSVDHPSRLQSRKLSSQHEAMIECSPVCLFNSSSTDRLQYHSGQCV
jgi:hypothetical protein